MITGEVWTFLSNGLTTRPYVRYRQCQWASVHPTLWSAVQWINPVCCWSRQRLSARTVHCNRLSKWSSRRRLARWIEQSIRINWHSTIYLISGADSTIGGQNRGSVRAICDRSLLADTRRVGDHWVRHRWDGNCSVGNCINQLIDWFNDSLINWFVTRLQAHNSGQMNMTTSGTCALSINRIK